MPELKNVKREKFAQGLAQGKTQIDAYVEAGYKAHDGNACLLAENSEIRGRVEEIIGRASRKTETTLASLINDAERLQKMAEGEKQLSAANQALKLRAELSGHYIQRKEDVTPRRTRADIITEVSKLAERRGTTAARQMPGRTGEVGQGDEVIPTVPGSGTA